MKPKRKSTWLKSRGYLHLTRQINVSTERGKILGKVGNPSFVSKHAFFPLIHTSIKVRRYKVAVGASKRSHSHQGKSHAKFRPLHYATHIDSMVFGYYAEQLQIAYLKELDRFEDLGNCVTAYRRIANPDKPNSHKSTIHFAHEVFEEIKVRAEEGCWVLKFDIEKFFSSMDHKLLKTAWTKLLNKTIMPDDHYNVFKAATKFSYILKDDLRISPKGSGKRNGFDEKQLSEIRKHNVSAFFQSPEHFRAHLKNGKLRVYKNEFRNSSGNMMGIPQGLPISATLANLYLLEFDKAIFEEIVKSRGGYYRRYSDDIIVICNKQDKDFVLNFVDETLRAGSLVEISLEKTEQFYFEKEHETDQKLVKANLHKDGVIFPDRPLTYLGFEFYGYKTLIKSANLSKFYRRMILAVKSRSKRAVLAANKNPTLAAALFRRKLFKLYTNINLDKKITKRRLKTFETNRFGYSVYKIESKDEDFKSNYFTYARRAAEIMGEPKIVDQVRRHRTIFNQAVKKQMSKNLDRYS